MRSTEFLNNLLLLLLLLTVQITSPGRIMTSPVTVKSFLTHLYARTPRNVFSVSVTGGGIQALHWLFSTPGASRCLEEGSIPYSRASLDAFLGGNTHKISASSQSTASAETTVLMSTTARKRALQSLLAETSDLRTLSSDVNIFGIACTAALASTLPKKGDHRCHVAVTCAKETAVYSLKLEKGLRNREDEDELCSRLILDAIAYATRDESCIERNEGNNAPFRFCQNVLSASESIEQNILRPDTTDHLDILDGIRSGRIRQALFVPRLTVDTVIHGTERLPSLEASSVAFTDLTLPPGTLVFPGSFNPLHAAHVELARVAILKREQEMLVARESLEENGDLPLDNHGHDHGCKNSNGGSQTAEAAAAMACSIGASVPVVFEIAAVNVDKPPLGQHDLATRILAILNSPLLAASGITNFGVSITSEPLFVRKSELFRSCTFVIGADTMARLVNHRYYNYYKSSKETSRDIKGNKDELEAETMDGEQKEKKNKMEKEEKEEEQDGVSAMIVALAKIRERGCSFVVGGRTQQGPLAEAGRFDTLNDILARSKRLPPELCEMFHGVGENEFRIDMSSSEIRSRS